MVLVELAYDDRVSPPARSLLLCGLLCVYFVFGPAVYVLDDSRQSVFQCGCQPALVLRSWGGVTQTEGV